MGLAFIGVAALLAVGKKPAVDLWITWEAIFGYLCLAAAAGCGVAAASGTTFPLSSGGLQRLRRKARLIGWYVWMCLKGQRPAALSEDAISELLTKLQVTFSRLSQTATSQEQQSASFAPSASRGDEPVLLFGEPVIIDRLLASGNPPFWAKVASIPVSNEPSTPTVAASAVEVRATLTFYGGETVLYRLSGAWGPTADESTNRTLPPNGQVELLGVAVRFDMFPGAHAFNADAPRTESALRSHLPLNDPEHHVHVHLRGSNVEAERWFLLRNYSSTGLTGVELRLEEVEQPAWADGSVRVPKVTREEKLRAELRAIKRTVAEEGFGDLFAEHAPPVPHPTGETIEQIHARVLFTQIGNDQERARQCGQLIERGHALRAEVKSPTFQELTRDLSPSVVFTGNLRKRLDRWCADVRGFVDANVLGRMQDLIAEDREGEMLDEWTKDSVVEVVDAHLSALRRIRDSIPPNRIG